jgi:hypothetical protein
MSMRSACARRGRWPDVILVFGSINIDLVIAAPRLPAPGETVIGDAQPSLPTRRAIDAAVKTHGTSPSNPLPP